MLARRALQPEPSVAQPPPLPCHTLGAVSKSGRSCLDIHSISWEAKRRFESQAERERRIFGGEDDDQGADALRPAMLDVLFRLFDDFDYDEALS